MNRQKKTAIAIQKYHPRKKHLRTRSMWSHSNGKKASYGVKYLVEAIIKILNH